MIELGGNIELVGFQDMDGGSMIVLKKIIGTYARKFSGVKSDFEKLHVILKVIHKREKSEKYEVNARLISSGKPTATEVTDRNLFVAIDSALKKLESAIS